MLTYTIIGFFILAFFLAIYVFIKVSRRKQLGAKDVQYVRAHWVRIIDMFSSNPKAAILDADKLLDYVLSKKGFEGTLGEKLKRAGARFFDLDSVWNAHKLRNRVAHELGDINRDEAKRALGWFKRALNDLGAEL